MTLFEAGNVSVELSGKTILHDVDLPPVGAGEVLGVLGPNAAGKSTLLSALSGQQKHNGAVSLQGRTRNLIPNSEWQRQIALVPQSPPQPSSLLPFELMWSAVRTMSLDMTDAALEQAIDQLFKQLGLHEFANTPLYALSGGKRQALGLALALIRNPQVLLLDEPTSALDLHWRLVVLDHVKKRVIENQGAAVIALHDLDLAARYCDKLLLMMNGTVVAAGTAADVLTAENIAHVYRVEADVQTDNSGLPLIRINKPLPLDPLNA